MFDLRNLDDNGGSKFVSRCEQELFNRHISFHRILTSVVQNWVAQGRQRRSLKECSAKILG